MVVKRKKAQMVIKINWLDNQGKGKADRSASLSIDQRLTFLTNPFGWFKGNYSRLHSVSKQVKTNYQS